MKKVLGFILILLLASVSIFYFINKNKKVNQLSEKQETITKIETFILYKINGEVFYKIKNTDNFISLATTSIDLESDTSVKTTEGKATAILPDNSVISIHENTELTVSFGEKGINIFQFIGSTYHRVEKLINGKVYEVKTPSTVASVRGTKFGVFYDNTKKQTKVSVTESKVEIADNKKDNASDKTEKIDGIILEEGKTITIEENKNISNKYEKIILETEKDTKMNDFVSLEKKSDEAIEEIKKEIREKVDFERKDEMIIKREEIKKNEIREKIKELIEEKINGKDESQIKKEIIEKIRDEKRSETKDTLVEIKKDTKTNIENKIKEELKKEIDTTKQANDDILKKNVLVEEEENRIITTNVAKTDEEKYFPQFEDLFINLFYVDEESLPCKFNGTPQMRLDRIISFARNNGYAIKNQQLVLALSRDIEIYCKTKDKTSIPKLQAKFDEAYPYQD